MSVHLPSILNKTPIDSLKAYFAGISPDFADVDWTLTRKVLTVVLCERINVLDHDTREQLHVDVDRIGQFDNDHGRRALRGVLPADGATLDAFDALEDIRACAIFVLRHNADSFDHALSAVYAQRLLNGRSWTGLNFEPGDEVTIRPDAPLDAFEHRIREIYAVDGPAPQVAVERFTRHELDPAGEGMLTREQFTLYVEAAPQSAMAFMPGRGVQARIERPVHEGALLLDVGERTLDVVALSAHKARRRALAEAFVETMLVPGAALAARARRTLALDRLKQRPAFPRRPDDGVRSIEVVRLVLGPPAFGAKVSIETEGRAGSHRGEDLYDWAERSFGHRHPLVREGWPILAAKLRIVFEPEGPRKRPKTVTFELKAPDRTNLRDQTELHRLIADTLLARWGLYATAD